MGRIPAEGFKGPEGFRDREEYGKAVAGELVGSRPPGKPCESF